MEAQPAAAIPTEPDWQYEPKWDGFRCLAFRDGETVELRSKAGQPLGRYFPDVVAAVLSVQARQFVLDGEIVIPAPNGDALSFDALLQRIHPAASRVQKLALETPAWFVVFDLLAEGGSSVLTLPLKERRSRLEAFARKNLGSAPMIRLTPATTDAAVAHEWFAAVGGSIDGVMAKRREAPYAAGERTAMLKIKRLRSADCVIGGFRYAEKAHVVGSLLLGLYDDEGLLHHVGYCSGLKAAERPSHTKKLEGLSGGPGFTGRAPGGPSRWSTKRSAEWQPVQPKLVVEVSFDHVTGSRFRHGTTLLRWRPDKDPAQCTMAQLQQPPSRVLELLETSRPRECGLAPTTYSGLPAARSGSACATSTATPASSRARRKGATKISGNASSRNSSSS